MDDTVTDLFQEIRGPDVVLAGADASIELRQIA